MTDDRFPPWVRYFLLPVTLLLLFLCLPYLLRPVAQVLLAVFAGILLAVFLSGCAMLLRRFVPLGRGVSMAVVLVLLLVLSAASLWLAGAQIAAQAAQLAERLPTALDTVRSRLMAMPWLQELFGYLSQGGGGARRLLGNLTAVFTSTVALFSHAVIIVFTGIYMAATPEIYREPLLLLIPAARRERVREVVAQLGQVMQYWLVGRLASMAVVGILTAVGLLLVGQPLALILGFITGLLSFIPFLGPVLAAVPAVLLALTEGFARVGWVLLVFAAVQFIEGNFITPFIERKAVLMPPAFVIAGQFLMGAIAGFYGVLLATPLLVIIIVLTQMLYLEDVLGERVHLLGDR